MPTLAVWGGQFEGGSAYIFPDGWTLIGGTYFLTSAGDTSINNTSYIKICASDSIGNPYSTHYAIREDSTGKVWWYDAGDNSDKLLHNFNLAVDDIISIDQPFGSISNWSQVVDSISTLDVNGSIRKAIYFHLYLPGGSCCVTGGFNGEPLIWIEGIGSTAGLFYPNGGSSVVDLFCSLTCYKENGDLLYGDKCNVFFTSIPSPPSNSTLKIFPNPFNDFLDIRFSDHAMADVEISITDATGRNMIKETKTAEATMQIATNSLPHGFYVVKINLETEVKYFSVIKD